MQYTEIIATTITSAITTGIITPIGAEDFVPVFLPWENKKKPTGQFRVSFKSNQLFVGLSYASAELYNLLVEDDRAHVSPEICSLLDSRHKILAYEEIEFWFLEIPSI